MQNQGCLWVEPDISGFLRAKGRGLRPWNNKFFVLKGSFLFCFKDEKQSKCEEVIPLEGASVEPRGLAPEDQLLIVITIGTIYNDLTRKPFYSLAAESIQSQAAWSTLLLHATLPRTELLVALQQAGRLQSLTGVLAAPTTRMSVAKAMRLSTAQAPYSSSVAAPPASPETKRRASLLANAVRKSNFGQTLRKTVSSAAAMKVVGLQERRAPPDTPGSLQGQDTSPAAQLSGSVKAGSARATVPSSEHVAWSAEQTLTSIGFFSAPVVQPMDVCSTDRLRPSVKFQEGSLAPCEAAGQGSTCVAMPRPSRLASPMAGSGVGTNQNTAMMELAQKRASLRPTRMACQDEVAADGPGHVSQAGLASMLKAEIIRRKSAVSTTVLPEDHVLLAAGSLSRPPPPPPPPPPPKGSYVGPGKKRAPPHPPPPPPLHTGKTSKIPWADPVVLTSSPPTFTLQAHPRLRGARGPPSLGHNGPEPPAPAGLASPPRLALESTVPDNVPSPCGTDICQVSIPHASTARSSTAQVNSEEPTVRYEGMGQTLHNAGEEGPRWTGKGDLDPPHANPPPTQQLGDSMAGLLTQINQRANLRPVHSSAPAPAAPVNAGHENPALLRSRPRPVQAPPPTQDPAPLALAQPATFRLRPTPTKPTMATDPAGGHENFRRNLRSTPGARPSTVGAHAMAQTPAASGSQSRPSSTPQLLSATAEPSRRHTLTPNSPLPAPNEQIFGILPTAYLHDMDTGEQLSWLERQTADYPAGKGVKGATQRPSWHEQQQCGSSASGNVRCSPPTAETSGPSGDQNPLSGKKDAQRCSSAVFADPVTTALAQPVGSVHIQPIQGWGAMPETYPQGWGAVPETYPATAHLAQWPGSAPATTQSGLSGDVQVSTTGSTASVYQAGGLSPMLSMGRQQYPFVAAAPLSTAGLTPMMVMGPVGPMLVMAPTELQPHLLHIEGSTPEYRHMRWKPPTGSLAAQLDTELRNKLANRTPVCDD